MAILYGAAVDTFIVSAPDSHECLAMAQLKVLLWAWHR